MDLFCLSLFSVISIIYIQLFDFVLNMTHVCNNVVCMYINNPCNTKAQASDSSKHSVSDRFFYFWFCMMSPRKNVPNLVISSPTHLLFRSLPQSCLKLQWQWGHFAFIYEYTTSCQPVGLNPHCSQMHCWKFKVTDLQLFTECIQMQFNQRPITDSPIARGFPQSFNFSVAEPLAGGWS